MGFAVNICSDCAMVSMVSDAPYALSGGSSDPGKKLGMST